MKPVQRLTSTRLAITALGALVFWACDREAEPPKALPPLPPIAGEATDQRGPALPTRRLTMLLSGEVRGEIEPCGCPTMPFGGFERRAGLVAELKQEGFPLFQMDAGHLLVNGFSTGGRGTPLERAELLLQLSQQVGVDVLTPGPSELTAMDPLQLSELAQVTGLPLISATWLDAAGALWFPASITLERGGLRLAVVGLSAAPGESRWRGVVQTEDPVLAARLAIEELPSTVDLVVALSNLPDEENDRVAREVPGLAAMLSTRGAALDEPRRTGNSLVVEVPNRGRYLTVVRARLGSEAGQALSVNEADRLNLRQRDALAQQVARMGAEPTVTPMALAHSRALLTELDTRLEQEAAGLNLASVDVVPLGTRFDGQPAIRKSVDGYKDRVLARTRQALASTPPTREAPPRYMGSGACASCHSSEFARWTLTGHARAWETLVARGASQDPECVTCHATGFALPGGWADYGQSNVRKFKAVQCEACHGPAEPHLADPGQTPPPVTEAVCLACHDEANSPQFAYGGYLPRASCVPLLSTANPTSGVRPPEEPLGE